jgi:hypothetical protein
MTDTTAQHIAAREDVDLRARLVAAAEQARIPNPEGFIWDNRGAIISTDIGDGTTLTSVHAYASSVYEQAVAALPPKPGINPAAVTDAQLKLAIEAVYAPVPAP